MKILSNTTVDSTVNGVSLATLSSQVSTNTTNISGKAGSDELTVGTLDGGDLGKLISINFDSTGDITEFQFEGGSVSISATIIT